MIGSVNRDPKQFPVAGRFDIAGTPEPAAFLPVAVSHGMLVSIACGNSTENRMSRPWIEVLVVALIVVSLWAQDLIERRDG
jgi:hypothetical protein